jgi:hypothetical protein
MKMKPEIETVHDIRRESPSTGHHHLLPKDFEKLMLERKKGD